jgi:pSer/pThr/pTyr-binding forkhead associated (FHA) protein
MARLRQWRIGSAGAAPEGLRLPLELVRHRPLTLGRSRYCDVVVAHDTVSRRHAEIRREGDRCYVTDLGSSNGTWVGGRRVERDRLVRGGDQLLLGGCLVIVL